MKKHKKHHNNYECQSVYADSCNKLHNWKIIGKHLEKEVIFCHKYTLQYNTEMYFSLHLCGIYLVRDSLGKSTICPQTDLYDWASTCSFTFLFLHHTKRFVLIFINPLYSASLFPLSSVFFSFFSKTSSSITVAHIWDAPVTVRSQFSHENPVLVKLKILPSLLGWLIMFRV